MTLPPLLRTGLVAYEQREFAAARLAWEAVAAPEGDAHRLCQGLARLARALEHAREGRLGPAAADLEQARNALEALPETLHGLDLRTLRAEVARPDALTGPPPRLSPERGSFRRSALSFAAFVLLVLVGAALVRWGPLGRYLDRELLVTTLLALRESWWAPLALVGAFLVVAPIGLPVSPLVLTGGVVFGATVGTLYNLLGCFLGAALSYQLARTMGRDFVARVAGRRLKRVELLLSRRGFGSLVGARLMPLPFSVVNFGAALAGVRPAMFLVTSAIGLIPPTAIYTYFAALLFEVAQGAPPWGLWKMAVALSVLFSTSVLPVLIERWRRRRRYRKILAWRAGRNGPVG